MTSEKGKRRKGEKKDRNAKQWLLNHSGCSAHVLENQSHSRAWQKQVSSTRRDTNMNGRRLFVTNWIIPWDVWCISKDLPDRGITSTACLVLSSTDCTPLSSTTKARSKSQPKIQKVCKWIWTPTFFCSSKSPSQQECLVNLTLLGWLGCYEPIAPVFPIWEAKALPPASFMQSTWFSA